MAGGLTMYLLLKKIVNLKNLLKIVTCAISKSPNVTQRHVKRNVKIEAGQKVRKILDIFVKQHGTEATEQYDKNMDKIDD